MYKKDGMLPRLWSKATLGFPQFVESRDEEEPLYRRTKCIDITGSGFEYGDRHGAQARGPLVTDCADKAVLDSTTLPDTLNLAPNKD